MVRVVKLNTILLHSAADTVLLCFDVQVSDITRDKMDADAADGCVMIAFDHQKELVTTLQGVISPAGRVEKE